MLAAAIAVGSTLQAVSAKSFPPLGPVLPAPRFPSKGDLVKEVVEGLRAQLDQTLGVSINASGISIGVKSIHEKDDIFSYHFTPSVMTDIGTDNIDENTIYRVGSVSKLFPAVIALQLGIDLDASVLEFLPELGENSDGDVIETIQWKDISAGSLMSHLSGLPTETSMDLTILVDYPWTKKGLPKVPRDEAAKCSGLYDTKPCGTAELIDALKRSHSVWLLNSSPVYYNTGFAVLALVIEAVTVEKFEDLVQERIFDVLEMDSTSFSGPVEAFNTHGFVPVTDDTWNITLGVDEPDILAFMEAVASNILLSPVETRKWLKRQSNTTSLSQSVGSPWEILRSDTLTSDKRVVDVYTKSGALGLYNALVGIIPDYDIIFSVMAGGPEVYLNPFSLSQLASTVITNLVPAIEEAGRVEASISAAGIYIDKTTKSTLELELGDGPGLRVKRLNMRGYNALSDISSYSLQAAAMELSSGIDILEVPVIVRLYPTDITNEHGNTGNSTAEILW
ncbi:beta-lactamase/transpeptidase-like protein [Truncatella angustata]|uniref:Beta-lactamase/transpeptidase-like protein n=1 Tax=Truncatella angustata TaxID=152316 RepID=A0A9P8UJG8_9PEZI|nr:beta-lactamase/transpeptidase-like protein [Truncatella angustata]KAH6653158.1 beta-lactamase/transpeptidase-like protein [Truncatella angustata]